MKLKAEILSKNYYDEEKMFGVYEARDMASGTVQSLVGKLPLLIPGEIVEGEVSLNSRENKYSGKMETQWVVRSSLLPSPPTTPDGIRVFLQSGFAHKVGASVAGNMVHTYGRRTIEVLKQLERDVAEYLEKTGSVTIDHLTEDGVRMGEVFHALAKDRKTKHLFAPLTKVTGVGSKVAAYLMSGWIVNRSKHELLLFLFNCGLSSSMAGKVIKALGTKAPEVLRENPYKLLHIIPSVSFSIPDRVAREQGMEANDERRLSALILHVMNSLVFQSGHVCVPDSFLIDRSADFLERTGWTAGRRDVTAVCEHMIASGALPAQSFGGRRYLYTQETMEAERRIAGCTDVLLNEKPHRKLTLKFILEAMSKWERSNRISLDESQKQALVTSLGSSVSILTGGPGTGKTTIMRCARFILGEAGLTVAECAPTGKAARNMSEDSQTIHRLLGLNMDNQSRGEPVTSDFLFADETSMMDVFLGAVTLQAITDGSARVIFVGDIDQLPSVGPGTVLRSMVDSGKIPVSRLDTVHRTEKGGILDFLGFVRNTPAGTPSPLSSFDLPETPGESELSAVLESDGRGENLSARVMEAVRNLIGSGIAPEDIQVLAPMKKGAGGVEALNVMLQKNLNPNASRPELCCETLAFGEKRIWAPGDRVMNIENDYTNDVFNGETGYISSVNRESKSITVTYPELDNKRVQYARDGLDSLLHAYAVTIHKSQGSEYKGVVALFPKESFRMAERALLYTAVSRARKKCVILGDRNTVNQSISTVKHKKRCSLLSGRISGEVPSEIERDQEEEHHRDGLCL